MTAQEALAVRLTLLRGGFMPLALHGKIPPARDWQKRDGISREQLEMELKTWPDARNTGILTRTAPAFDVDIVDEAAARAVEGVVRDQYEERGHVLVRIGRPPKRAFLFRVNADESFKKITVNFVARNSGEAERLEFLASGQQLAAFGTHPDTHAPYRWFGGEPGPIAHESLPYIGGAEASALIERVADLLVKDFGYVRAGQRPRQKKSATSEDTARRGTPDWQYLTDSIRAGESLHDSLRDLAAKLVRSGMTPGATVNLLRGLMEGSTAPRDDRWRARYAEIPRLVDSAEQYRADEAFDKTQRKTVKGEDKTAAEPRQFDGDPVDLWGNFEPPILPRGLLPELIENYAFTQAETMGVDPGGVAMAALAVCAAATPDSIKLVMKRHTSEWTESARLWVALVGLPSVKKSPIISATIRPLAKLDVELLKSFLFELQLYEQMEKDERKKAPKPVQKRLRLEDTTIEAAQQALAGSPNGVLMVQDELSGFFAAMDKYSGHRGAAKDRAFWLQSYNGGQYALNRVGRGAGIIPNLSVSLLGGIQPDVIRRLSAESYDDGFLQRMLLVVMRPGDVGKDVPTPNISVEYATLIRRLTEMRPPICDHDDVLRFDNRAQALRDELEVEHLSLMQLEAINRKLAAHIGKYDGLFGRLCVAFHCIEHASGLPHPPEVVTGNTATRVAKFMRGFLLPHAFAFYGGVLKLADDHDRLAAVAGYILAHQKQRTTNRDVQRGDGTMRKLERRDIEAVFEQLDALGWVTRTPGPRPSDAPHWIVNPVVHQKFAERGKAEAERRKRERAIVGEMLQRGAAR